MERSEYLTRAREFASRGESRHNAKMDKDKVNMVRDNPRGMTAKQLAEEFGVHYRTIEKIRSYETWTHV